MNRKWVITPVINGISRVNPLITGVITHLRNQMATLLIVTHSKVNNKNIIEISNCGNFLMSICLNMTSINSFHVITPLLSY